MLTLLAVTISLNETVIPVLIAIISSGFLFGLIKVLPERRSILIQASENAVRVVNEAVSSLQHELSESRQEVGKLESQLSQVKTEREKMTVQIEFLQQKVSTLEAQIAIYTKLIPQSYQGERGPQGDPGIQGIPGKDA